MGHARGFYATRRETQLFAHTPSGMAIFVLQSHFSFACISQDSYHGMHSSQLDATNCPTTRLRSSLFCFSNLGNKGVPQATLTRKSYIFNSKWKGREKRETSFSYSRQLSLSLECPVSTADLMPPFNTSWQRKKALLSFVQKLILGNSLPVTRGLQATRRDSFSGGNSCESNIDYRLFTG